MALAIPDAPRLLIVRRDNIGDLVCTTPLIAALRERFPRGRIAALVNTYNAGVLAGNPALDAVYAYEKTKHRERGFAGHVWSRLKLQARLRKERFDCVLVPSATPQALRLARSLGAGEVLHCAAEQREARHEVENTFALARPLGVAGAPGPMKVFPDAGRVRELRREAGAGPFVAVHVSARRPMQRWPAGRYAALIAEIAKEKRVLLLWAPGSRGDPRHPGDDEMAAEIARAGKATPVATPDLATLVAALSLADCVILPDGGAMHLAAALGKPVVALFGDSPPERWRPWGVPHRVVRPESRNLADLALAPVLSAYRDLAATSE
jgi:ADP-heptose:LPS heptosyltransferase